MQIKKLKSLLEKTESIASVEEDSFEILNISLAGKLRSVYGASNCSCSNNNECSNNDSCTNNGCCTGNCACNRVGSAIEQ
jgi:hypothetical protein